MDIAAHAMWAIVLLPGPPSLEKAVFGILPDIAVFVPDLIVSAVKGKKRDFKTRKEMMTWYNKPGNRWKLTLYKWTHSLFLWTIFVVFFSCFYYMGKGVIPWFVFGGVVHILLDIPTHTRDSFPVAFLTPFSAFRVNGYHWSNRKMIFANYLLLIIVFYLRLFLFGSFM